MTIVLHNDVANAIFDILVDLAGARPRDRWIFVDDVTTTGLSEWRFGGDLGFGGKVRYGNGRFYVNCYPEDLDPDRSAVIERTNNALSHLTGNEERNREHRRIASLPLDHPERQRAEAVLNRALRELDLEAAPDGWEAA